MCLSGVKVKDSSHTLPALHWSLSLHFGENVIYPLIPQILVEQVVKVKVSSAVMASKVVRTTSGTTILMWADAQAGSAQRETGLYKFKAAQRTGFWCRIEKCKKRWCFIVSAWAKVETFTLISAHLSWKNSLPFSCSTLSQWPEGIHRNQFKGCW